MAVGSEASSASNMTCACASSATHRLVIFNRVPKCGSTSLEAIIRREASDKRFAFVRSSDYVNNTLDRGEQASFARLLNAMTERHSRVLYDRHVLYVDFATYGMPQPTYINLLRDPLRMQVSAFYFWRQCVCVTRQSFCASVDYSAAAALCQPGYGIDTLYANVSARPQVGLITRWFCGHGRACGGGSSPPSQRVRDEALRRAMHHLRERYVWVGILERLEDSLRLLAKLLPAYFGKMAVAKAAREHVRPQSNSSAYKYAPPSEATLAKLRIENAGDLQLYAHAVDVLECRLHSCGLIGPPPMAPQASTSGGALAFRATSNVAATYLLRRRHRVAGRTTARRTPKPQS